MTAELNKIVQYSGLPILFYFISRTALTEELSTPFLHIPYICRLGFSEKHYLFHCDTMRQDQYGLNHAITPENAQISCHNFIWSHSTQKYA
jgi:hypothetical protein